MHGWKLEADATSYQYNMNPTGSRSTLDSIGYRKGHRGGVWLARKLVGRKCRKHTLDKTDDFADPDGLEVLNYQQVVTHLVHTFAEAPTHG